MNWTHVDNLIISDAVMGRAAAKILNGQVTAADVAELPACHYCVVAASNRSACWHHAARILFAQGLRPWPVGREDTAHNSGPEQLALVER